MQGMHAITDMQRIVAMEARSAGPRAPIRPDGDERPGRSRLDGLRLLATRGLRALANALEPAGSPATARASATPNPCP